MRDEDKTKEQLINELAELRQRIADLEALEAKHDQMEKELRSSQGSFAEAQRIAHLGNWDWDIKNDTVHWSDEIYRLFGLKPGEFGATYDAVLDSVHPDDRELVQKAVDEALHGKRPYNVEHRIVRPDGSVGIIQAQGEATFDESGQPISMTGTALDITRRKRAEEALRESEEKLRWMLESVTDGITVTDLNGVITEANERTGEIHGGGSKNELLGKSAFELIAPSDHERAMMNMRKTLTQGSVRSIEYTLLKADGSEFPGELSASVLRDASGNPVGFIAITRDITERKQAEAQLLAYQKELRSLASQLSLAEERERRRIATELHDRVSQTLAICRMKLGALEESAPSTRFAENLSEIHALIKQLIEEIRSLTFEISSPLLYELGLEAAVEQFTEQIQEQYGVLTNFEDDGQPKPLDDDIRVLLFQAVRELLNNITKHAQAHNARVCITRHDSNLRITVEDDGVGFDSSGISSAGGRTKGFGLFSIRERLHHISGHIEIESEYGRGTQVTLVAPLKLE